MADVFRRVEKKYILNYEQFIKITDLLENYVEPDEYGKSKICNIYFDNENYDLISHSITKPYFKEKVRLRSYNTPKEESNVFLEIKRKEDSVVGKRRIVMKLSDFNEYVEDSNGIKNDNKQIKTELDYYFKMFNLEKKMYISYDREAFYDKTNKDFRITFDSNIIARNYNLNLENGSFGSFILSPEQYVMEIKTLSSIPLWFVKVLDECKISPCGFSKYGEAYTQLILKANNYQKIIV